DETLTRRLRIALLLLIGLGSSYFVLLPLGVRLTITGPTALRILVVLAFVSPLGVLLGVPFATGLRLLQDQVGVIPWMWTLNAGATVFGSVLATMMVMHVGFSYTFLIGTAVYGVAFVALPYLPPMARGTATSAG